MGDSHYKTHLEPMLHRWRQHVLLDQKATAIGPQGNIPPLLRSRGVTTLLATSKYSLEEYRRL